MGVEYKNITPIDFKFPKVVDPHYEIRKYNLLKNVEAIIESLTIKRDVVIEEKVEYFRPLSAVEWFMLGQEHEEQRVARNRSKMSCAEYLEWFWLNKKPEVVSLEGTVWDF